MSALVEVRDLVVRFGGRVVVDRATLRVERGEVVGLIGPNGAGKTTLLRAAIGLLPAEGERLIDSAPLQALSSAARAERVGYLAQGRRVAWGMAAWRIAALGAPHLPAGAARRIALEALTEVGAAHLADRSVFELSGGEQAKVLLARLLATQSPLLVCDEPVAGLDPDAQLSTLALLRAKAAAGAGVLVTLHDLNLALGACDRVVVVKSGRVVADAPPVEALDPEVVRAVFGLAAATIAGPYGPLLALERPGPRPS